MSSDFETNIRRIKAIKNLLLIFAIGFLFIGLIAYFMGYGNKIYYIIELVCLFLYYPMSMYYDKKEMEMRNMNE
ncbi:MAG: hypothetical protein N4A76_15480 [Firmicutes bacterium]|jgi:hypothetical protein|nr:hypothetical protein [Bacillota bacterium]